MEVPQKCIDQLRDDQHLKEILHLGAGIQTQNIYCVKYYVNVQVFVV
jgi:hypothetical protein